MTFDLRAILIIVIVAFLYAGLLPRRLRAWALLIGSVMAIYWLQPALPIRFSDFILPTIILSLTGAMWWFSRDPQNPEQIASLGEDRLTLMVIGAIVLALSFNRFLPAEWRFTSSRPPDPLLVLLALGATYLMVAGSDRLVRHHDRRQVLTGAMLVVIGIFVVLKTEVVATEASRVWRVLAGQDTTLASPLDLNWLGFSYVAFRLIHTLRDR